jgi:YgiT-type zinc finger domain-containing protein
MLKITECPTCGSKRIRRVVRTIKGVRGGRAYSVPGVAVDACPTCGEILFDHAAMQKIEAHQRKLGGRMGCRKAS